MINFRCWYCNRSYSVASGRARERLVCSCGSRIRIPRESGGRSRDRSMVDWLVEALVYGGGGALLGGGLALIIVARFRYFTGLLDRWIMVLSCAFVGFLAGLLGGEAGVNWVGRIIRREEE
jgi:hypothetical protein